MSERIVEQRERGPYRIQGSGVSFKSPIFEVLEFRTFSKISFCLLTGRL